MREGEEPQFVSAIPMARSSTPGSDKIPNINTPCSSTFHKVVCLQDWWLIKAEKDFDGKRLAIGGLTSREQRAVRLFSSAPIIKRHDLFTLKTADGITIMLKGTINRSRTQENGFLSEVCNHFLLGFPYYWEACTDQFFEKVPTTGTDSSNKQDNTKYDGSDGSNEQESMGPSDVEQHMTGGNSDIERNSSCSFKMGMDTQNITPSTNDAKLTSCTSGNLEGNGEKSSMPSSCAKDEYNELNSISDAFESPSAKHLTGRSASKANVPPRGKDTSKEIVNPSKTKRSSSRLKNLKNTVNNGLTTERNKSNYISMGSDLAKNNADNVNSELGGRNALDHPEGLHETIRESSVKELDNQYSKCGSQMNCILSSVPSDALQGKNHESVGDGVESSKHNGSCRSPIRLGDMNYKSDSKFSAAGEESHDDKRRTSQRKTKSKSEYISHVSPPPLTRNKKKNLVFSSPELLSYKRSRSGRLLVPPLDFWRNQKAVYGVDGKLAGVQDGLPMVKSLAGSKSEPSRKKKKSM